MPFFSLIQTFAGYEQVLKNFHGVLEKSCILSVRVRTLFDGRPRTVGIKRSCCCVTWSLSVVELFM